MRGEHAACARPRFRQTPESRGRIHVGSVAIWSNAPHADEHRGSCGSLASALQGFGRRQLPRQVSAGRCRRWWEGIAIHRRGRTLLAAEQNNRPALSSTRTQPDKTNKFGCAQV